MSKDLNLLERCTELDVDGHVDAKGVRYMGRASKAARRYLEMHRGSRRGPLRRRGDHHSQATSRAHCTDRALTAPEPTWHFHNMVRRRTSSNQGEQPTKPPMPPPPLTTVGVNTKHYTRQEVDEQMNLLEQLMLQPGVTIAQQNAVMLQRLNVGGPRCNVLRERLRKVWVSQDDASRPADRAVAIRGIKRMLAHAEGQRTPDGQGWARHPNHTAVARYQHLLADLQGTRMPIEVRLHHEVSTAMADVIGNLTEEQVQEYFDRWQETCRKASEFDARQLAAAE